MIHNNIDYNNEHIKKIHKMKIGIVTVFIYGFLCSTSMIFMIIFFVIEQDKTAAICMGITFLIAFRVGLIGDKIFNELVELRAQILLME